jgi:hypothetical protein
MVIGKRGLLIAISAFINLTIMIKPLKPPATAIMPAAICTAYRIFIVHLGFYPMGIQPTVSTEPSNLRESTEALT